jgi:hypothetical protein
MFTNFWRIKFVFTIYVAGCKCAGFKSSYTCNCGEPTHAHHTLVETKEEREARGHPVGQDVPYAAMGGITGFSSLADGYIRLDPSGRGEEKTKTRIQNFKTWITSKNIYLLKAVLLMIILMLLFQKLIIRFCVNSLTTTWLRIRGVSLS